MPTSWQTTSLRPDDQHSACAVSATPAETSQRRLLHRRTASRDAGLPRADVPYLPLQHRNANVYESLADILAQQGCLSPPIDPDSESDEGRGTHEDQAPIPGGPTKGPIGLLFGKLQKAEAQAHDFFQGGSAPPLDGPKDAIALGSAVDVEMETLASCSIQKEGFTNEELASPVKSGLSSEPERLAVPKSLPITIPRAIRPPPIPMTTTALTGASVYCRSKSSTRSSHSSPFQSPMLSPIHVGSFDDPIPELSAASGSASDSEEDVEVTLLAVVQRRLSSTREMGLSIEALRSTLAGLPVVQARGYSEERGVQAGEQVGRPEDSAQGQCIQPPHDAQKQGSSSFDPFIDEIGGS
ncbi:hypothetical protein FRB99_006088 [Tulasnella sp. 403]|nr:hypothetical protein FRB99_006088 [Tulasnella sp. 403]